MEKKLIKENKNANQEQQQWGKPANVSSKSNKKSTTPSFKQIMADELNYANSHKPTQVDNRIEGNFLYSSSLETSIGFC